MKEKNKHFDLESEKAVNTGDQNRVLRPSTDNPDKPMPTLWRRLKLFMKSRYIFMILAFLVAGGFIFFHTASLLISSSSSLTVEKETGISRQMTILAPRGILTDRFGQPLAYNIETNVLYLANAGLRDPELNAMLLDLTGFLDQHGVSYDRSLEDYLAVDPVRYTADMSDILYWQKNTLGLKDDNGTGGAYNDSYVKIDPNELFRYLAEERFKIADPDDEDNELDEAELFRVMRLRYRILADAWAFSRGTPLLIAEGVDISILYQLEEQSFRYMGLVAGAEYRRAYSPVVKQLAHVIGYVGAIGPEQYDRWKTMGYDPDAIVGQAGVEASAEQYLTGRDGERPYNIWTVAGVDGTFFPEDLGSQPVPGHTVRLTIDPDLQNKVMEVLQERVDESASEAGAMVIMDVNNGDILAMASYPTYDPRDFLLMKDDEEAADRVAEYLTDTDNKPMLNRTIMENYAPGSTFKLVMTSAGLEFDHITPQSRFQCQGYVMVDGLRFGCLGVHGWLDLPNAIRVSCNSYFYQLGLRIGIKNIDEWTERYGLGEYTNIDLPGEIAGMRSNPENKALTRVNEGDKIWNPADTVQSSIGQFDHAYTVLQLARYTAALATGNLVTPHIIKDVTSYDGVRVFEGGDEPTPIDIDQDTLDAIRTGMLMLTDNPGGNGYRYFRDFPVKVAMKTGTAEVGTSSINTNGLLISFAPADNPQIAIAHTLSKNAGGSAIIDMQYEIYKYIYMNEREVPDTSIDEPGVR